MKKMILFLAAALLPLSLQAGEITAGSVPETINYQGRLERDNAPVTGPVHLYFRIYNDATANNTGGGACGGASQPCLWESPEITVQATQGIFSADVEPPMSILAGGQQLYVEIQVESDILSPREPLASVAYAMMAKRLEDGADVSVSTLTAQYTVKLATETGAYMTVGTNDRSGSALLTVNGLLKLVSGSLEFPDGTSMVTANVGSASGVSSVADAEIRADSDGNTSGDIVLRNSALEYGRVTNSGLFGIGSGFTADGGAAPPSGRLDVDGNIYVGNEGIYDRDDAAVNVKESLVVEEGNLYGKNGEYMTVGSTNNVIGFVSGGSERVRIHTNGYLGVGTSAPAVSVHSASDIAADDGVRGGQVSIGDYSTWTDKDNEIRSQTGTHLLLQETNSYNVGIGTDTPREKLHVRGSVRSDYGIIAATAAYSSDVRVDGDFDANSSQGNMVYLSTTVIYGTLQVTGGIGSEAGVPAYLNSTQTLTGQNTFLNQVVVSSDIVTINRLGAGVDDFDFAGTKYLQVGDDKPEFANDDATAYLVGGSAADARLRFYRGSAEAARLETQSGENLGLVVNGETKTLTDATYHRIQNSVVWVSTAYNTTPAIYVSSWMGNVGMGTSVMDPNWQLTVDGNIRLQGAGSALIFADGTSMTTSSATSANNVSSNGDAVVQSNADLTGGGDVILRAGSLDGLMLNTGGNVGIGTLNPVSRLNLRGGDLVLGTPYNPYDGDSTEDLVVGGNIAFDGSLVQRSLNEVQLYSLRVANNVYLSTTAAARTGIGTDTPGTTLDVEGDAQFGTGGNKSSFSTTGVLTLDTDLSVPNGGTGAGTFTDGGILFGNGTAAIGATAVLQNGELLIGDGTQEPTLATLTGTGNRITVTNGAGSITLNLPQDIHTSADPTFDSISLGSATISTALGVPSGGTGLNSAIQGDIIYASGADTLAKLAKNTSATRYLSNTGASNNPAWAQISLTQGVSGVLPLANGGTNGLLTTAYGGTGADLSAETVGAIPYFSATGVMNGLNAGTANYLLQANGAAAPSWVQSTNTNTANTIVRRNASGDFAANDVSVHDLTATGSISGSVSGGSTYIQKTVGTNDYIRVRGSDTGFNDGYLEIATADNGNEPIYARQYSDTFSTVAREAILLDASGHTHFPGYVYGQYFNMTANAVATNPEYLVGEWSGDNFLRYVTPANVTVGNASSAADLSCSNCVALGTETSGTLPLSEGGTGANLSATGGSNQFVRQNSAGGAFTVSAIADADVPNTITLNNITQITNRAITNLSGTLTVGNGGTGATTLTGVLHGNGAGAFTAGNVALGSEVSGTLPVGNGGTGATTLTGVLHGNGAGAFTAGNVALGSEVSGTLPVGNGGTGLTGGNAGKVVCWKTDAALGTCSDQPDATGSCTCE